MIHLHALFCLLCPGQWLFWPYLLGYCFPMNDDMTFSSLRSESDRLLLLLCRSVPSV